MTFDPRRLTDVLVSAAFAVQPPGEAVCEQLPPEDRPRPGPGRGVPAEPAGTHRGRCSGGGGGVTMQQVGQPTRPRLRPGPPSTPCLHRSVWTRLQDIHEAFGLRHQWGGSHCNKVLLSCLGIDTRNIVSPGRPEASGPAGQPANLRQCPPAAVHRPEEAARHRPHVRRQPGEWGGLPLPRLPGGSDL